MMINWQTIFVTSFSNLWLQASFMFSFQQFYAYFLTNCLHRQFWQKLPGNILPNSHTFSRPDHSPHTCSHILSRDSCVQAHHRFMQIRIQKLIRIQQKRARSTDPDLDPTHCPPEISTVGRKKRNIFECI